LATLSRFSKSLIAAGICGITDHAMLCVDARTRAWMGPWFRSQQHGRADSKFKLRFSHHRYWVS
jgi:hypothetical protein